jgi:hypothetical protein
MKFKIAFCCDLVGKILSKIRNVKRTALLRMHKIFPHENDAASIFSDPI